MLVQEMTVKKTTAWKLKSKSPPRLPNIRRLGDIWNTWTNINRYGIYLSFNFLNNRPKYKDPNRKPAYCAAGYIDGNVFKVLPPRLFSKSRRSVCLFFNQQTGLISFFQAGRWGSGSVRTGNQEIYIRAAKHAAESVGIAPDSNNPGLEASSKQRERKEGTLGGNQTNMWVL